MVFFKTKSVQESVAFNSNHQSLWTLREEQINSLKFCSIAVLKTHQGGLKFISHVECLQTKVLTPQEIHEHKPTDLCGVALYNLVPVFPSVTAFLNQRYKEVLFRGTQGRQQDPCRGLLSGRQHARARPRGHARGCRAAGQPGARGGGWRAPSHRDSPGPLAGARREPHLRTRPRAAWGSASTRELPPRSASSRGRAAAPPRRRGARAGRAGSASLRQLRAPPFSPSVPGRRSVWAEPRAAQRGGAAMVGAGLGGAAGGSRRLGTTEGGPALGEGSAADFGACACFSCSTGKGL